MKPIAMQEIGHICSDFPTKFGIPRQSGLVEELEAAIVFEPEFRNPDALRGLEWSPTVRPPRLGGNKRMGVFATRSPFRPNPIGLSCVKLKRVELSSPEGPKIWVTGADLLDGTPILDIKPYLPYADCQPQAVGGFAAAPKEPTLAVEFCPGLRGRGPAGGRGARSGGGGRDRRAQYQKDPERVYALEFAGMEVKFRVQGDVLTVCEVNRM